MLNLKHKEDLNQKIRSSAFWLREEKNKHRRLKNLEVHQFNLAGAQNPLGML